MKSNENPHSNPLLRWVLCLAGLGTILPLLGFLYGMAPMPVLAGVLLAPAVAFYVATYAIACRRGNTGLRLRFERGAVGGLLGIAGYDLVRVPIHLAGLNPFAAIQSYGVYLTGAEHSSMWTDVAGILYHTGNGLFFGIMFTMIVGRSRATPVLALVWALVLEGFAAGTVFGIVYHLRQNTVGLGLAFFAHLFYGAPLAWAATRERILPRHWWLSLALAGAALASVFVLARPPDGYQAPGSPASLELTTTGIHPRWTSARVGRAVTLHNRTGETVTVEWPFTTRPADTIAPGGTAEVAFGKPGIYQVRARRTDWRSVFLIVRENGYLIRKEQPKP